MDLKRVKEVFSDWAVESNNGLINVYKQDKVDEVLSVRSYAFTEENLEAIDEAGMLEALKRYIEK